MKELEELTREIREKLPRLKELPIIGLDPMLNDVLQWINDDSISIYCDGCFCHAENGLYYQKDGNIIIWDMSKTFLKDQSLELIKFLMEEFRFTGDNNGNYSEL